MLVLALGFTLLPRANAGPVLPTALNSVKSLPATLPPMLRIRRAIDPEIPFSVVGPRGALLGREDGVCEAWIFPWKIFSNLRIVARMQNYNIPISVNHQAAQIEVTPSATIITYSHANFTIRQIMFAPKQAPQGEGVLILFQIEAIRPMVLTISFRPVLQRMWPAPSDPMPLSRWVPAAGTESGFYILHEDFPGHAAALAMPTAEPGIMAPTQERARNWPLQFVLHFDPSRDQGRLFPLLMAVGDTSLSSSRDALARSLAYLDASVPALYLRNAAYYHHLLEMHTKVETPNAELNEAFSWAITAVDQLRVITPEHNGEALTAGFMGSSDSDRPGYGWFFGRDALWALYAVDSYGGTEASRQELEFLIRHQRRDGKILHEYSQAANLVDWPALPYEYASADATPLFLMALGDYLNVTGDSGFVRNHWSAIALAWKFETSHDSSDDIYDNSVGTGWVESWVPSMPHQEIYLALLDEQATAAFANLARATDHDIEANKAEARAGEIRKTIDRDYYLPSLKTYAFSRDENGAVDETLTIMPAVAWWTYPSRLEHPFAMMSRWASSEFDTDWGTRILSNQASSYNPISYQQGSVWPLFTGWVAVAEYRSGHPLAGYAAMMQNVDLTRAQDLGDVTEVLSGKFYHTLGRSTAHQLWSSAMVISPILRGLFGLEWDAPHALLIVTPNIPANWDRAAIRKLPFGNGFIDLRFVRKGATLVVTEDVTGTTAPQLASRIPGAKGKHNELLIPLPPIQIFVPQHLPGLGAETHQMKVIDERYSTGTYTLTVSAPGGTEHHIQLWIRIPGVPLKVRGAETGVISNGRCLLTVSFPVAKGYVSKVIHVDW